MWFDFNAYSLNLNNEYKVHETVTYEKVVSVFTNFLEMFLENLFDRLYIIVV
jgi:hypothetical protein